ncbi:MAG: hypothetical protein CRN43_19910 [Candidatus Nephrothrix sp. EaCA]|nr:MAG: hypothetical protein CRN43_19910 [Candidatus Nephrothrix sp. EaCA]
MPNFQRIKCRIKKIIENLFQEDLQNQILSYLSSAKSLFENIIHRDWDTFAEPNIIKQCRT